MLFRQTSLNIVFIGMLWIPFRFSIEFTLHSGLFQGQSSSFSTTPWSSTPKASGFHENHVFIVLSASGIYNRFTALMSQLLRHGSQPPKKERSGIDFRAGGNSFGFFIVTKSHALVEKPELNNSRVMSCRWTAAQIAQRFSFIYGGGNRHMETRKFTHENSATWNLIDFGFSTLLHYRASWETPLSI